MSAAEQNPPFDGQELPTRQRTGGIVSPRAVAASSHGLLMLSIDPLLLLDKMHKSYGVYHFDRAVLSCQTSLPTRGTERDLKSEARIIAAPKARVRVKRGLIVRTAFLLPKSVRLDVQRQERDLIFSKEGCLGRFAGSDPTKRKPVIKLQW